MLGYLLDGVWGTGGEEQDIGVGRIRLAGEVRPGPMTVEWWDADRGSLRERTDITHPGGTVELAAPAFRRHLAFKLLRRD
jgi:hypothetical protein